MWMGRGSRSGPWPRVLACLFALASLSLLVEPLYPEFFGGGKTMDYPLWYAVGQRMLHGEPVYVVFVDGDEIGFDFLYTPFAALLLAIPSYFGKTALVAMLASTTLVSWWAAIALSNRMAVDDDGIPPLVVALPVVATLPFVYDQFHIGQPNLMLLALMLGGLFLLGRQREIWASLPFALAAAIKIFPLVILPYLVWRRHWRALAGMAVLLVLFLVIVPGAVRGFQRNFAELEQWVQGMLLSGSDRQFSLRSYTYGWKNQSIFAVEHRFLRRIDAEADADEPTDPIYVNFIDLDRRAVDLVFVATSLAIGLAFIAAMPARRRNARSDAAEWGILLLLMVVATPVARIYYFVWLLMPYTLLARWAAREPDRKLKLATAAAIGASLLLFLVGINELKPRYPQAVGNALWATVIVMIMLAAYMRRAARVPADVSLPEAADMPRPVLLSGTPAQS
jgi:hypothetical protein